MSADIATLARHIAAAGSAGPGDVSAFLRGVYKADAAQLDETQLRMARAVIAGKCRNSRAPYDLERARCLCRVGSCG